MRRFLSQGSVRMIALLAIICCSEFGCSSQTGSKPPSDKDHSSPLRMADTRFMGLLPFYVADEEGMFKANGIQLIWVDVREPAEAVKVFLAGDSDIVISTFAGLLPAEIRQPGTLRLSLPVYEPSSQPSSAILVRPNSSIKTIADLKGKRLGTYAGATQRAYAVQALKKAGLRVPEDVDVVQVATAAQVQSLLGGAFDALFTVEPHVSIAENNGAVALIRGVRPKLIADPFWVGAVALRTDIVDKRPTVLSRLMKSLASAVSFIRQQPQKSRAILARRTELPDRIAATCGLYEWETNLGEKQLAQIQAEIDSLRDSGQLTSSVDVRSLFLVDTVQR